MLEVVLSGMRPTGKLHIGHVEGVLRDWVALQETARCYYFVADWHAMTTNTDTGELRRNTIDMVKDWIATGVDPEKSTLFVQSQIPQHAELSLALSMLVNLGRLERLPTFNNYLREIVKVDGEDKKQFDEAKRANVNHGFLGYPVLQTADILLYKTTLVPVGEDQLPHIELTRELARRFNTLYGTTFIIPEPKLGRSPRILGNDGRKMSKSYGNVIEPTDTGADLTKRILQMKTDPARQRATDPGNPYECSVYDLHEVFTSDNPSVATACSTGTRGCKDCKLELAHTIDETYHSFRERRSTLTDDFILDVLATGTAAARTIAEQTMREAKHAMHLDYFGGR